MGEAVTGGTFALLGVEPLLGRAILPEDDVSRGGHPVVMLSHGYWQRAFGADPQVIGRTVRMGGRDYTIIGAHALVLRADDDAGRADGRQYARSAQQP
jgi:hypothetical protein